MTLKILFILWGKFLAGNFLRKAFYEALYLKKGIDSKIKYKVSNSI